MTTTQMKGPEALEHAVAAVISAQIAAELDAIWTAWAATDAADGLVIPKPYPAHIIAGRVGTVADYPAIMVASDHGQVVPGEDAAPNWAAVDHILAVIVWMTGDKTATINKLMHRYNTAIWEILTKNQQLDGSVQVVGIDPLDYGRAVPVKLDKTPGFTHVGGWTFVVHTLQGVSG